MENVFLFASPSISATPVIDTESSLPAWSFTSCDYLAPLPIPSTSPYLLHSPPSPHPSSYQTTTTRPKSPPPLPPTLLDLMCSSPSPTRPDHFVQPTSPTPSTRSARLLGPAPFPPFPSPPLNRHLMQTRAKNVIIKPNLKYGLTTIISPFIEPCIVAQALQDPKWVTTM